MIAYGDDNNGAERLLAREMVDQMNVWPHRALFQVHVWTGICSGLYVLMFSLTGSVLVYRNELFRASPRVMRATEWLLDLHDNLLAADAERRVNGACAFAVLALTVVSNVSGSLRKAAR